MLQSVIGGNNGVDIGSTHVDHNLLGGTYRIAVHMGQIHGKTGFKQTFLLLGIDSQVFAEGISIYVHISFQTGGIDTGCVEYQLPFVQIEIYQ